MLQKWDDRNKDILVWIGDKLYPREEANVSVFDSTVQGGDAVWEGLRVHVAKIYGLHAHLDRMHASAKALAFEDIPSHDEIRTAIFTTLNANNMMDEVHIRLTLSRGEKITSGMDPRLNESGSCLIVLAEWKPPVYSHEGINLITSTIRRNPPESLNSNIHHNNLLNNIQAKIEANVGGADDAIMLDINGFVAETNATNIFMVKDNELHTPTSVHCLPGITRATVIRMAKNNKMHVSERDISIEEFYNGRTCCCK